MNTRYQIEKLNGSNYLVWAKSVELVLRSKKLWGYVEGKKMLAPTANDDEKESFEQENQQALAEILLNIEPRYAVSVIAKASPMEAWDTLSKMNKSQAKATQATLRRKLLSTRKEDSQSIQQFGNSITKIENELASSGYTVSSFDKCFALLEGLPASYDTIRTVLREKEDVSFEEMVGKLEAREEELKQKGTVGTQNASEGEKVQALTTSSGGVKQRKGKKGRCHFCKKKGHYKADSNNYKPHLAKEHTRNRNGADSSSSNEVHIALLSSSSGGKIRESTPFSGKWIIDSGATQHMCNDASLFSHMSTISSRNIATGSSSTSLQYDRVGTVVLRVQTSGVTNVLNISNVAYVPRLRTNLLSVPRLQTAGLRVEFPSGSSSVYVMQGTKKIIEGVCGDEMIPEVKGIVARTSVNVMTSNHPPITNVRLLHKRLGHVSYATIKEMVRQNAVDGLQEGMKQQVAYAICNECQSGKATATPHKPQETSIVEVGELVHADLVGPITPLSIGKSAYILTVLDDASGASWVAFCQRKTEAAQKFMDILNALSNRAKCSIQRVRTDRGTEFLKSELQSYFAKKGIYHEMTAPYSPESNGRAERLNRTLVEAARTIMAELRQINSDVSRYNFEHLWAEAINTANYLRNRVLNKATGTKFGHITPYEVIYQRKPTVGHLRIFGTKVHVLLPVSMRKAKFDSKTVSGIHLGYASGNAYRVYIPSRDTVIISRDVTFLEELVPSMAEVEVGTRNTQDVSTSAQGTNDPQSPPPSTCSVDAVGTFDSDTGSAAISEDTRNSAGRAVNSTTAASEPVTAVPQPRRSSRPHPGPPQRYTDNAMLTMSNDIMKNEIQVGRVNMSIEEVMTSPNKNKWIQAMKEELQSLVDLGVFEEVNMPKNREPVGSRWVFEIKKGTTEGELRFKARIVAKGYSQISGVDYNEKYSPVVKMESLRAILALAAKHDYEIKQLDIKSAFLNADLEEEVFVEPPALPVVLKATFGGMWNKKVWKLLKALYGLKQSSRAWNRTLKRLLNALGFKQCLSDPGVYIRKNPHFAILLIYVDDLLVITKNLASFQVLLAELSKQFKVHEFADVKSFIGLEILRDRAHKILYLHQKSYINRLLRTFGMRNCCLKHCPMTSEMYDQLNCINANAKVTSGFPYRELLGSLMFLMSSTRPDIAFCVSFLSRFMQNYTQLHCDAAKDVLRYLKYTQCYALSFSEEKSLEGYTDASWAGDELTRKSLSGYIFKLNGAAISWKSKLQSMVAASSMEAEYIAQSFAIKEALWLRSLFIDLDCMKQVSFIRLHADNTAAIALAKEHMVTFRNKHIATHFHFQHDYISKGIVKLDYISTNKMVADGLTKPLNSTRNVFFTTNLGFVELLCSN